MANAAQRRLPALFIFHGETPDGSALDMNQKRPGSCAEFLQCFLACTQSLILPTNLELQAGG
jgi:hypothetical protein